MKSFRKGIKTKLFGGNSNILTILKIELVYVKILVQFN